MSVTIINDVYLVDLEHDRPPDLVDILIANGRIQEIGKVTSSNSETIILDGGKRYALPGLIDAHTHATLSELNLRALGDVPHTLMTARATNILRDMLMRGFTTVRDAAGADWGLKQAIEDGEIIGPRMFISVRALSQTGGHGDVRSRTDMRVPCACESALGNMTEFADGENEVRKSVRELFRQGADQIKVMASGGVASPNDPLHKSQYSPKELQTIVEEAERRGSYVMAHLYDAQSITLAIEAGIRTIEHGNLVNPEAARLAQEKGTYVVPTLTMATILGETGEKYGFSPYSLEKLDVVREAGFSSIKIWKDAGVKIGFGSDLLGDTFHAQSREFLLRAQVESPQDVLRSATLINAEILQKQGQLGLIAPGAIADILLVEGNPLNDLNLLQDQGRHLKLIMKEGKIFKNELQN